MYFESKKHQLRLTFRSDQMRTPPFTGVRLGSDLNKNAYMHEQITIGFHEEEVSKLMYTLFCCKPVI